MVVCGEFCTICTILKGLLVVAQVCSLEKCRFVSAEGHFVFWPSDKRFEVLAMLDNDTPSEFGVSLVEQINY